MGTAMFRLIGTRAFDRRHPTYCEGPVTLYLLDSMSGLVTGVWKEDRPM